VPEIANAPAPTCNRTVPDGLGMGMRNAQWLCQRTNRQRKGRRHRTFLGRLTCAFAFTVAHLANPSPSVNRHSPPLSNFKLLRANRRSPLHYSLLAIRHSPPFPPVANRQSPFANRCRFRRGCLGRTAVRPYHSPFATRCRFHQSLFASRYSPPFPSWLIATPTICQSLIASRQSPLFQRAAK
jgi:hypothetical protein